MTNKFFFALLVVTYGSLVFLSLAAAASQDKESNLESHGRDLQGVVGLLYRIYRIYRFVNGGQKVIQFVNWTSTQAQEYLDGQCFAYCRTPAINPFGCECDVSTTNVQPLNLRCNNFPRHCCGGIGPILQCQQCCTGPRPQSQP